MNAASCATSKIFVDLSRANKYHCVLCTSACSCLTMSLDNSSVRFVNVCNDNGTDRNLFTMYFLLGNIVFAAFNMQDLTRSA